MIPRDIAGSTDKADCFRNSAGNVSQQSLDNANEPSIYSSATSKSQDFEDTSGGKKQRSDVQQSSS